MIKVRVKMAQDQGNFSESASPGVTRAEGPGQLSQQEHWYLIRGRGWQTGRVMLTRKGC